MGLVLNVHDRVVNIRIKLLAERRDLGYAELFERLVKLHHRHFHDLAVRFVCRRRGERSFQIVVDRKELEQRVRLYIGIQTLALFLAALAEVIVLGAEPEVLFLFRLNELFGRFLYLGLFFGLFLLLFIFFILFFIQDQYNESKKIKALNEELNDLNVQLKGYAEIKEKMGETKERNR